MFTQLMQMIVSYRFADALSSLARAFDILKFFALNLFRWRHLANSSDRLFNVLSQSDLTNDSFSSRQRLHLEPPAAREGTRLIMDHLMVNFRLLCLSFHAYLESSVSVEYRTLFKDFLWFAKRSLNVPAVIPIYSFVSPTSVAVISAL